jgi:hypothetical protein
MHAISGFVRTLCYGYDVTVNLNPKNQNGLARATVLCAGPHKFGGSYAPHKMASPCNMQRAPACSSEVSMHTFPYSLLQLMRNAHACLISEATSNHHLKAPICYKSMPVNTTNKLWSLEAFLVHDVTPTKMILIFTTSIFWYLSNIHIYLQDSFHVFCPTCSHICFNMKMQPARHSSFLYSFVPFLTPAQPMLRNLLKCSNTTSPNKKKIRWQLGFSFA